MGSGILCQPRAHTDKATASSTACQTSSQRPDHFQLRPPSGTTCWIDAERSWCTKMPPISLLVTSISDYGQESRVSSLNLPSMAWATNSNRSQKYSKGQHSYLSFMINSIGWRINYCHPLDKSYTCPEWAPGAQPWKGAVVRDWEICLRAQKGSTAEPLTLLRPSYTDRHEASAWNKVIKIATKSTTPCDHCTASSKIIKKHKDGCIRPDS